MGLVLRWPLLRTCRSLDSCPAAEGGVMDKETQWCIEQLDAAKLYVLEAGGVKLQFNQEAIIHMNVIRRTIAQLKALSSKRPE